MLHGLQVGLILHSSRILGHTSKSNDAYEKYLFSLGFKPCVSMDFALLSHQCDASTHFPELLNQYSFIFKSSTATTKGESQKENCGSKCSTQLETS